jgi:putative ABC transport system permease protein
LRFLPLIFANLGRKKIRTLLTIGSFAVALFLFGILVAVRSAFSQGIDSAGVDRLMVVNRSSIIQPLPYAYREQLAKLPGVTLVQPYSWFGGVYQDEKNFFPQFAIDPEHQREMFPEFHVSDAEWKAFTEDKAGCIAGENTARRFGWKVGDRIPIKGTLFQGLWEFNLRGIYHGSSPADDTTQFWLRQDYLYERAPAYWKGFVGWYTVRIKSPDLAAQLSKTIDAQFTNSAWETRAQTEKAMAASFAKQMGNIEFLVIAIGAVVFFTLLLVIGNTLATAVRERTADIAVLKAVGYSDGFVLGLILFESSLIAVIGGGLGLGLVKLFTLRGDPTGGLLPNFYITSSYLASGLALAVFVGIVGGILPALSAMRLRVVEALRKV